MLGFRFRTNQDSWITVGGDAYNYLSINFGTLGPFQLSEAIASATLVALTVDGSRVNQSNRESLPPQFFGLDDTLEIELVDLPKSTFFPNPTEEGSVTESPPSKFIPPCKENHFISFLVTVNDSITFKAGAPGLVQLDVALTAVSTSPATDDAMSATIVVAGLPVNFAQGGNSMSWLNKPLSLGDLVRIKIVEVDQADSPMQVSEMVISKFPQE